MSRVQRTETSVEFASIAIIFWEQISSLRYAKEVTETPCLLLRGATT